MSVLVALCFLVIFTLLLLTVSFGLRFYENQRRKKLVSMLRTVTEDGEEHHINLLIEDPSKRDQADSGLGSINVSGWLARRLSESGLNWTLPKFLGMSCFAFAAGALGSAFIPVQYPPVAIRALGLGLVLGLLPFWFVSKKRASRIAEMESQLPDALDFLARSMRAGHAFTISLEMVGEETHEPLGQEFRALFNEHNLGASLERSFASFSRRVPIPDVRFFSSAVLLQRTTGGNLSEILNRLSHIIRERFRLKGQVKAVSAHGRLTATILTILPIATLGGLLLMSPSYLDPMFHSSVGRKIVAAGVVAQFVGNFFIRKIIRIKV